MVNFWALDTVPEKYREPQAPRPQSAGDADAHDARRRTASSGRWIAERLNRCEGPVRFLIPEGGVSGIDAPGQPFHDPDADAALFTAIEQTLPARPPTASSSACRCTSTTRRFRRRWSANFREIANLESRVAASRNAPCPASPARRSSRSSSDMIAPARADHRRRRRHRPVGQVRGGRRHRPHRHLQFRPLPHGRPRLAGRACSPTATPTRSSWTWRARCCRW